MDIAQNTRPWGRIIACLLAVALIALPLPLAHANATEGTPLDMAVGMLLVSTQPDPTSAPTSIPLPTQPVGELIAEAPMAAPQYDVSSGILTQADDSAMEASAARMLAPMALLTPTLSSVPTPIQFSLTNVIPAADTVYTAQSVTGNLKLSYPALLSLNTLTITVSLSEFTSGSQKTLKGARLMFAVPTIANSTGLVVLNASNVFAMNLQAGGASATLLSALNISLLALGSSTLTWTPDMVTLKVLGGTAMQGTSSATLNWTMAAL